MQKEIRCYRCGKVHDLQGKQYKRMIECTHCHGKMCIDGATEKKTHIVSFCLIVILILAVACTFPYIKSTGNYMPGLIALVIAAIISMFYDKLSFFIVRKLFGLSYKQYIEDKKVRR